MNELMVVITTNSYLYWKTKETDARYAYREMQNNMERIGINIDNLWVCELILRNENGEDIDSWKL